MEDDHVDRLDVQARQRVELTSTNRPIGLIALMIHARLARLTACRHALLRAGDGTSDDLTGPLLGPLPVILAGLVARARRPHPIPSRTRP